MDDIQRFTWVAEHLKSFRLAPYRGGTIIWIDDQGFTQQTSVNLPDELEATDVAILRACVDKALTN